MTKQIVIIGGGFAGLWAAAGAMRQLSELGHNKTKIEVTVVSREPYLTIRPRLYEALTEDMRVLLPPILDAIQVTFVEATVTDINFSTRLVLGRASDGAKIEIKYDRLVLAMGSVLYRPDIPGLSANAFSIDTYEDAVALAKHLKGLRTPTGRDGHHTIAVIGAGFTGVEVATEMAGRLAELFNGGKIVLIERADMVVPDLGIKPRPVVEQALRSLNVETVLNASVSEIRPTGVCMSDGRFVPALTTIWTAGMRANAMMSQLPLKLDNLGRAHVDEFLFVNDARDVLAAGDVARAATDADHFSLMSCQHAQVLGKIAGHNAVLDVLGRPPIAYSQPRYVTCLDLGTWGALFTSGWDRSVEHVGAEAKQLKRKINTEWIYPPRSGAAADILAAAAPTPPERKSVAS